MLAVTRKLLQNLLELFFLFARQTCRELDFDANDKVAPLGWLLRLWHSEVRIFLCPCWTCRPTTANVELLVVDGLDRSSPACECFFEVEFNDALDVVAFAGEECMRFL
jgi:hypothetical protein